MTAYECAVPCRLPTWLLLLVWFCSWLACAYTGNAQGSVRQHLAGVSAKDTITHESLPESGAAGVCDESDDLPRSDSEPSGASFEPADEDESTTDPSGDSSRLGFTGGTGRLTWAGSAEGPRRAHDDAPERPPESACDG